MNMERDRVISISLTQAEWHALVARRPRPVDWLRALILDELASVGGAGATAQTEDTCVDVVVERVRYSGRS
jgi:hypothetical protein